MSNIKITRNVFTGVLSALTINADKDWDNQNITNFGVNGYDVHQKLSEISAPSEIESTFLSADCLATTAVKDVVYLSSSATRYVLTNSDNKQSMHSIGVVVDKPTTTTATVQTFGPCSLTFSELTVVDKPVFLSATGGLTTSKPSGGYLQTIGFHHYLNMLFIKPSMFRVRQNPF